MLLRILTKVYFHIVIRQKTATDAGKGFHCFCYEIYKVLEDNCFIDFYSSHHGLTALTQLLRTIKYWTGVSPHYETPHQRASGTKTGVERKAFSLNDKSFAFKPLKQHTLVRTSNFKEFVIVCKHLSIQVVRKCIKNDLAEPQQSRLLTRTLGRHLIVKYLHNFNCRTQEVVI